MGIHATTCPKCASTRCRESRWASHEEKSRHPNEHPYRCLMCSHRFIAAAPPKQGRFGHARAGLVAGAAAVVLGGVGGGLMLLWPTTDDEVEPPRTRSAWVASSGAPDASPAAAHPSLDAANDGDLEAQFRVGRAALLNHSLDKANAADAVRWLQQAAGGGHTGAMLQLGKLYRNGVGVPQNYEYAERWIRSAANAGDSEAMVELGRLYRGGFGVKADLIKAYVWFNRAAAAMNMEGAHERDLIALKLNAEELKTAQDESLASEEPMTESGAATLSPD